MLIGKSVNSLGYFEENGAQNACFTISNESLSTQQNNRKYNDFNEVKHSCDNFDITTKKKIHIKDNKINDYLQQEEKSVKESSNNIKRNIAKYNDYYVSVIDDEGKIQITEVELAKKFSISKPTFNGTSNIAPVKSNTTNLEKSLNKGFLKKRSFLNNRIFGSSDETLNSRSSRVNICELGEETISNTSEYEINDLENDNRINQISACPNLDNENSFDKVQEQINRRRLVSKKGYSNISLINVPRKQKAFMQDIFTTAVDMPWRYTIGAFVSSFFISWFAFTLIWYLISLLHGDLDSYHLPNSPAQMNGTWVPCVTGIYNLASCFLFSVETQHTIGYGGRATSEECPHAIIVMCIQSIIGVLSSTCMAGIVFAKLSRPKRRAHTIAFSKNAVVTMRNGWLYLLFRVGNLRTKSNIIETHVTAKMVYPRREKAENQISFDQEELKVSSGFEDDNGSEQCFMMLPNTICHKIDESSPFYSMGPKEIVRSKFELVVFLEGIVESTGNTVQTKTSYLPREILWGYRFENMVTYNDDPGVYLIDCSYMNAVIEDENTPDKSMADIMEEK